MSIQVDTTNWIKGKHYPEWMNEISLSMINEILGINIKNIIT